MSAGFTIGGILLSHWETPEEMSLPSGQKVIVHKLIGGKRQVDAMGPDPEPLSWSGRARGRNATSEMQAIKAMCDAGAAVTLSWDQFSYQVIITKFDPKMMRSSEWKYSITVEIVDDSSADSGGGMSSLDSLVGGDLSTVMGLIG